MKTLFYTNLIFLLSTLTAYVFIDNISGLLCQFFLGIIQLLYFLLCRYRAKTISFKKHLKRYKLSVIFTFIVLVILLLVSNVTLDIPHVITIIFVCVIPMSIATYFVYITYLIQKQ